MSSIFQDAVVMPRSSMRVCAVIGDEPDGADAGARYRPRRSFVARPASIAVAGTGSAISAGSKRTCDVARIRRAHRQADRG